MRAFASFVALAAFALSLVGPALADHQLDPTVFPRDLRVPLVLDEHGNTKAVQPEEWGLEAPPQPIGTAGHCTLWFLSSLAAPGLSAVVIIKDVGKASDNPMVFYSLQVAGQVTEWAGDTHACDEADS